MSGGGYGGQAFGGGSYGGGSVSLTATAASFDIFCFQGTDMLNLLGEPSVTVDGNGLQFVANPINNNQEVCSGGAFPSDDARITITENVGATFTVEWIVSFDSLPNDFSNLVNWHIYLGAYDAQGPVLGFFVSKIGWAYTGSVSFPSGNLQLDTTFQPIPGSSNYSYESEYLVIRAAVSLDLGIVYFYVTRLSELAVTGQQLRAILPVIPASAAATTPVDGSIISVRGTATQQACAFFDSWCLGSALIIPNLAPVANAGLDQAVRTCSIVELDGTASFDPEGANLLYQWRLIEAPIGSELAFEGYDGVTFPLGVPTGFTDKFHTTEAGVQDALDVFSVGVGGDVLLDGGVPYTIVGKGIDGNGFYLQIGSEILPDNLSGRPFKVLRQRGLSNATSVNPTFFPDLPGFYSFDLTVFDGALLSNPSVIIINVLESPLPRGCTPDLTFIFNYLSDFWNLVEGRDRISVFWGALAQVVATELFTLWQFEYSKSLRDIQRTFNRRWLHYDLLLGEPIPELTRIRPLFGGITSSFMFETAGVSGVNGAIFAVSSQLFDTVSFNIRSLNPASALTLATEIQDRLQQLADERFTVTIIADQTALESTGQIIAAAPGSYTDGQVFTLSDGINAPVTFEIDTIPDGVSGSNIVVDISAAATDADVAAVMETAINAAGLNLSLVRTLATIDITHDYPGELGNVTITTTVGIPGTFTGMSGGVGGDRIVIDAPFPFTIASANTLSIFSVGAESRHPSGTTGYGVGSRTYKVERSLLGLDVREDDFLILGGAAYRIANLLDSPADAYRFQRIIVKEDLPVAPSGTWAVSGWVSSEFLDFYNGLVADGDYADFTVFEKNDINAATVAVNEIIETTVLGVSEVETDRLAVDQWGIGGYAADADTYRVLLARVLRRTYVPISSEVKDVPTLQRLIVVEDDQETLRRNLDYFIRDVRNGQAIRFISGRGTDPGDVWEGGRPPDRLWAEYTFLDNNQMIEDNFGRAVELTVDQLEELPDTVDYLSAVRGLWYAFFNGPTLRNLRIGVQILLGLPFAEVEGTIEEIRTDFSPKNGRMLVRDTANEEIVRVYRWPRELPLEVNPDTGERYVVGDTVSEFAPLVEGAEVVDYITDPDWFQGLLNQGIFYEVEKFHKFLVRIDTSAFSLSSLLFVRNFILKVKPTHTFPVFLVTLDESNDEISVTDDIETTGQLLLFDSPCDGLLGVSWMYDQPRAAGGGWRNQFDSDVDPNNAAPTYPTPDSSVGWAYDKSIECPMDDVKAVCCVTFGAPTVIQFDTCFAFDTPVQEPYSYQDLAPSPIPAPPGGFALTPTTGSVVNFNGTLVQVRFITLGDPGADPTDYEVVILVNAVAQAVVPFTAGVNTEVVSILAVPTLAADTIGVAVRPASGVSARNPNWSRIMATVDNQDGTVWTFGQALAAGTYCLESSV